MYAYKATLNRVIDGDTIDVKIDLGFDIFMNARLRLENLDTFELRDPRERLRVLAELERVYCEELLDDSEIFTVHTTKKGKYGRYLATVILNNGCILNEEMKVYHKTIQNYNIVL